LDNMPKLKLTILIGQYSKNYYLKERRKIRLTETVASYKDYSPDHLPLSHPSPRNRFWLAKNPWFESEVLPELQNRVKILLP